LSFILLFPRKQHISQQNQPAKVLKIEKALLNDNCFILDIGFRHMAIILNKYGNILLQISIFQMVSYKDNLNTKYMVVRYIFQVVLALWTSITQ